MTALVEEASGITVAWARLVSGGGVNGAGAALDRRLRSCNAWRGRQRSFSLCRVQCGLRLHGHARFLLGKPVQGANDGERREHDAYRQHGLKDETKTPHCKIPQQAPTILQEAGTGKTASEKINGNFSLLRFSNTDG